MKMMIRSANENDWAPFYEMLCGLDSETAFMMYEPGERSDPGVLKSSLAGAKARGDFVIVAEEHAEIVGFLWAERGAPNRIRHTAYIVTGIRKAWQGKGIGTAFFGMLDDWANQNGVLRLELTVECNNTAALHLYEKMGFAVEGRRRKAMRVSGEYIDEFYMGKLVEG